MTDVDALITALGHAGKGLRADAKECCLDAADALRALSARVAELEAERDGAVYLATKMKEQNEYLVAQLAEAQRQEPVMCHHEAYQGRCIHCDCRIANGAPVPAQPSASSAVRALDMLSTAALDHYTPHMICVPTEKWVEAMGIAGEEMAQPSAPKLSVWYGPMPESNGKSNYTALLVRDGNIFDGLTLARSEYPDRVRYEADVARYLIGELSEKPSLLDYDGEKHSGYVEPSAPVAQSTRCSLGVGCDEAGVCYALAHGQPERCPVTKPDAPVAQPDLVLPTEIEEVLACLGDDIDTLLSENEDSEIAANMRRAHDLLFNLANCPAESQPAPAVSAVRPMWEVKHCDDPEHGGATGWMLRKNYIDPNGIEGAALLPIDKLVAAYERSLKPAPAVADGLVDLCRRLVAHPNDQGGYTVLTIDLDELAAMLAAGGTTAPAVPDDVAKDAARYRALRDRDGGDVHVIEEDEDGHPQYLYGEEVDDVVDSMLAAGGKP